MILLIIGSVLLLFGIFVFFKKNEGETEISLLGAKVKSNNSGILLITLGAIIAAIGANNYMNNTTVAGIRNTEKDVENKRRVPENKDDSGVSPASWQQTENVNNDLLVGSWELSQSLSGEKALIKMFGSRNNVPQGINDVMVVAENKATFTRNGYIDFDGDLLCQFKDAYNNSFDMKLRISYTGKWAIEDNQLRQTIEHGNVVPTNEISRSLFAENPVSLNDFGYAPGTTESYPILQLNESSFTIRDQKTREKITWTKANR